MMMKRGKQSMSRQQVFTGSPWEPLVGYCRAIRVGNRIEVAGTTAMQDGVVVGAGDPYARWEEVGKAHGEVCGQIQPVATMVEVSALIDPLLMVEIEVEAVIESEEA